MTHDRTAIVDEGHRAYALRAAVIGRVTPHEMLAVREHARSLGITVSQYVRASVIEFACKHGCKDVNVLKAAAETLILNTSNRKGGRDDAASDTSSGRR